MLAIRAIARSCPSVVQNAPVLTPQELEALPQPDRALTPEECAALARAAAELIDVDALDRRGEGTFELLWRTAHSEAWLNTWWQPRDTGFHDHGGSCVGVHVLEGRARAEGLIVGGGRRVRELGAGDSYAAPATAIHRMEHEPGAVTIHVYSPPLAEIGHYEVVDGELHRHAGARDEISPPSPKLSAALGRR
jgi:mannose-6-phosphate isomerase-like protein (cupin superfamily)